MKRKSLTYEQARAYIQGEEPFDAVKYEENHVLRLAKVCKEQREKNMTEDFKVNFRKTVLHWIELHKDCENIAILMKEYERI